MKHRLLLVAGCVALCAAGARAQPETREGIAQQNQILELRRQLQDAQRGSSLGGARTSSQNAGGAPSAEIVGQLLDRVTALEEEVRRQRGRQDELANAEQRHYEELNKQIGDLNFKLQGAPASSGPGPSTNPSQGSLGTLPAAQPPLTGPVRRTPEVALQDGNAAMARRDYPAAEAAAREVLANNRTSPRAYDAQFLLAEALAGKRDNPQAAIAYDDAYNRSRTGAHAPDALLGLANALGGINEKKAACDTLAKFATEFPRARGDQKSAADAARQRNGCR